MTPHWLSVLALVGLFVATSVLYRSSSLSLEPEELHDKTTPPTSAPIKAPAHNLPPTISSLVEVRGRSGQTYRLRPEAVVQIQNFQQRQALLLNVHITHQGGTHVCDVLGHQLRHPSFACMINREDIDERGLPDHRPWTYHETADSVTATRQHYDFVSWEFRTHVGMNPLWQTNWDTPQLVSLLVIRHPISRLLAGDERVERLWPGLLAGNGTEEQWWHYAKETKYPNTNNYALAILAGYGCCNGADTERRFLVKAQELVKRFTIVLDIECLNTGLEAVADLLHLELEELPPPTRHERPRIPSAVEIFLYERIRLDIELYKWARQRALVDCGET